MWAYATQQFPRLRLSRTQSFRGRTPALLFVAALLCGCSVAQEHQTSLFGGNETALGFAPEETAHLNRKKRLEDISRKAAAASPKFYEYLVQKKDSPALSSDVPVLRVVFQEKVFFDTAHSEIRPEAEYVLDIVAEALRKEPGEVTVFVAGHADARGTDAYNLELSVKRANAVAESLAQRGVGPATIWKIGFGKAVPLRPNDTADNMALNRRVEFIVGTKLEAVAVWLKKQPEFLCSGQSAGLPQLCKEPQARESFTAVPVERTKRTNTSLSAPPQASVGASKIAPINITLSAPLVEQVGRPQR